MRFSPDDQRDLRSPVETASLDIPALACEHGMAGSGEGDHVGETGTPRQTEAGIHGETEQVQHPLACQLFHRRGGGRGRVQDGVLVPGRRQPVGADGGRECPAEDEAEVARPAGRHQSRLDSLGHPSDDGVGGDAFVRQVAAERGHDLDRISAWPDMAAWQPAQVLAGELEGDLQGPRRVRMGRSCLSCLPVPEALVDSDALPLPGPARRPRPSAVLIRARGDSRGRAWGSPGGPQ